MARSVMLLACRTPLARRAHGADTPRTADGLCGRRVPIVVRNLIAGKALDVHGHRSPSVLFGLAALFGLAGRRRLVLPAAQQAYDDPDDGSDQHVRSAGGSSPWNHPEYRLALPPGRGSHGISRVPDGKMTVSTAGAERQRRWR